MTARPARLWQQAEGALVLLAALSLLWVLGLPFPVWLAVAAFFAPDLSFAFYAFGPRVGAAVYNTVHLYGFGAVVALVAHLNGLPVLAGIGMLWIAHAGFDRMLGYGLKLPSGFQHTHLGRIGRG
ncbi:DUF4260 domain-containing protein [Rhodobacter sp. SGA-6-6]|uniref:DUF4260 domain-containing protein n=1 Tax=Rhodobacter sp. SGA-6-6 TaxID=2710882 RepID=UPI0013ECB6E5|nr:DUF4260 domain-containing protein [Rhodobacter sp. SGA-6-6]NGM47423.1 DUF4260 domain-containing protein [Rhodobacter sp. SGA-6-6]